MRIMFDKNYVKEFHTIDSTPAWKTGESTKDNPSSYSVGWFDFLIDEYDYIGEYMLDGTIETYQKAVHNFESICEKLLTKGYCRADDFENFEWY